MSGRRRATIRLPNATAQNAAQELGRRPAITRNTRPNTVRAIPTDATGFHACQPYSDSTSPSKTSTQANRFTPITLALTVKYRLQHAPKMRATSRNRNKTTTTKCGQAGEPEEEAPAEAGALR